MKLSQKLRVGLITCLFPISAIAQETEVKVDSKFANTLRHLDTDGDALSLSDEKDFLEDMSKFLDATAVPMMRGAESLRNFNTTGLLNIFGIDGITAKGSSSKKHGNSHIFKFFLESKNTNNGMLSVLGSDAQPLVAQSFAPADTDILLESDLNMAKFTDNILSLLKMVNPEAEVGVRQSFTMKFPGHDFSVKDFLSKFHTRVSIAVSMDTHGQDLSKAPTLKATLRADKIANYIWGKFGEDISKEIDVKVDGNQRRFVFPEEIPGPEGMMKIYVVFDLDTDHIWMTIDPKHLASCQTTTKDKTDKLANTADYKQATKHLAKKGNSQLYISKKIAIDMLSMTIRAAVPRLEAQSDTAKMLKDVLAHLKGGSGIAAVVAKDNTGILLSTNTPFRIRGSFVTHMTMVSTLASITTPLVMQKLKDADRVKAMAHMKHLYLALIDYQQDNSQFPAKLSDLVKEAKLSKQALRVITTAKTDRGERALIYTPTDKANGILLRTPAPIGGKYVVLKADGAMSTPREDSMRRMLAEDQ